MDTFPYESWEEAIAASAASEGAEGYFTFGPGGGTGIVILTILGIALALAWTIWVTVNENQHLAEVSERLNAKWGI